MSRCLIVRAGRSPSELVHSLPQAHRFGFWPPGQRQRILLFSPGLIPAPCNSLTHPVFINPAAASSPFCSQSFPLADWLRRLCQRHPLANQVGALARTFSCPPAPALPSPVRLRPSFSQKEPPQTLPHAVPKTAWHTKAARGSLGHVARGGGNARACAPTRLPGALLQEPRLRTSPRLQAGSAQLGCLSRPQLSYAYSAQEGPPGDCTGLAPVSVTPDCNGAFLRAARQRFLAMRGGSAP